MPARGPASRASSGLRFSQPRPPVPEPKSVRFRSQTQWERVSALQPDLPVHVRTKRTHVPLCDFRERGRGREGVGSREGDLKSKLSRWRRVGLGGRSPPLCCNQNGSYIHPLLQNMVMTRCSLSRQAWMGLGGGAAPPPMCKQHDLYNNPSLQTW